MNKQIAKVDRVKAGSISEFIDRHYRHFNAAVLKDAAEAYVAHLDRGGKMMITLAGAMSTAELGVSLAEMIRQDKVHAITCTGANLEEDLFNLVARSKYERIPNYRELSPQQEKELLARHLNRVTDTCIPEEEAIRRIERAVIDEWVAADKKKEHFFPHEFLFKILRECRLKKFYEIDPADSWMMAAAQKDLPLFVPGWEDSTLGYHRILPLVSFKSAGALQAISRFALCPCSIKTWSARLFPSGVIFARSVIPPPASDPIPAPCPTKKSPGAN